MVRADVGDLSQARTVAVTAHGVVMIVAPPGSPITSIARLRDHNRWAWSAARSITASVEVLKKEYDLGRANVTFTDIAPADARHAVQTQAGQRAPAGSSPDPGKYLSFVKVPVSGKSEFVSVADTDRFAGAIADVKGPYESFDIPKGTLRGAPPVPDDDVTTLRVAYYLVANKHLSSAVVADLAKKIMGVRRDLVSEQPLLSGFGPRPTSIPTLTSLCIREPRPSTTAPRGKFHGPLRQRDLFERRWHLGAFASIFRRGVAISRGSADRNRRHGVAHA